MANGNGLALTSPYAIGIGGTGVVAVLVASLLSVAHDASTALDVMSQHGSEFIAVRAQISQLRLEVKNRTESRYTERDAERDLKAMNRRLDRIEADIKICKVVADSLK